MEVRSMVEARCMKYKEQVEVKDPQQDILDI